MLSMLLKFFGTIAVTLIIYSVQKYLSTRKVWQLGAVVPLFSIAVMIILYFVMQVSQTTNYIFVGAFLLLSATIMPTAAVQSMKCPFLPYWKRI